MHILTERDRWLRFRYERGILFDVQEAPEYRSTIVTGNVPRPGGTILCALPDGKGDYGGWSCGLPYRSFNPRPSMMGRAPISVSIWSGDGFVSTHAPP